MNRSVSRRCSLFALAGVAMAQSPRSDLAPADLDRVKVGQVPPDFDLPSASGGKLSLASLRGKNVVLVFYRGHW